MQSMKNRIALNNNKIISINTNGHSQCHVIFAGLTSKIALDRKSLFNSTHNCLSAAGTDLLIRPSKSNKEVTPTMNLDIVGKIAD
jgi:hypothetical protein